MFSFVFEKVIGRVVCVISRVTILGILSIIFLCTGFGFSARAQTTPVQASLQLIAPYPVSLGQYASPIQDRLHLTLLFKDQTAGSVDVRFKLTIKGPGGLVIQTDPNYRGTPFTLQALLPEQLSGFDLSDYFTLEHLVFSGDLSKNEYRSSGHLPEGAYVFKLQVVHALRTDVAISNLATASAWLTFSDPPMISMPICGSEVSLADPQNIQFQWTPMHMSSPLSTSTEYLLQLVEIRPKDRDPNDAMQSTQPVFETTTTSPNYFYGPADPPLTAGTHYAFRVRAIDPEGNLYFKNNGYSTVCSFTYGQDLNLLPPENITLTLEREKLVHLQWQPVFEATSYKIAYRGADNASAPWHYRETASVEEMINDLAYDMAYDFKVQSLFGPYASEWSEEQLVTTLPKEEFACGEDVAPTPPTNHNPLITALPHDKIRVGNFEMEILKVKGQNGIFSGIGSIYNPQWRLTLKVVFDKISINELYEMTAGKVNAVSTGMEAFIAQFEDDIDKDSIQDNGSKQDTTGIAPMPRDTIKVQGVIDSVYVDPATGSIVVLDSAGNQTTYPQEIDPDTGEMEPSLITDSQGNSWTVDKDGNVSRGSKNGNSTEGRDKNQSSQSEELIVETLQYLQQIITAWQDGNTHTLPECIPSNNDLLSPIVEQIENYQDKPGELLSKFSNEDQSTLSDYVNVYNQIENPSSYQEVLSEENWQTIVCKTYSYLNDLAQGLGEVVSVSNNMDKVEEFIEGYRTVSKQGLTSFNFTNTDYRDVAPGMFVIRGVSSLQIGLIDHRDKSGGNNGISLIYDLQEVTGTRDISGTSFENSAVFQFYRPGWNFSDPVKLQIYSPQVEVDNGLDSKTLLADYLPGKYDYEAVQNFINKIIDSHDKGEETLNMGKELANRQVYARNVDFGDKGIYDLYISRTGDFNKDENSFYSYTKTNVALVMGFNGTFTEYRFFSKSGGTTYISLPTTQSQRFESSVLKLYSVNTGMPYIDLVKAIRAANLNADNKLDITEYGSDGGLSPVFEIYHDGEKLKLMIVYPLLGNKKNKIDPFKRPEPVTGQTDNAMGEAGHWVLYEFENKKGSGTGHNIKIYVMASQMELFESYLLIAQEVLITGINWRSQTDSYFNNKAFTCYGPPNICCFQASKTIIEQFGITTDLTQQINMAELANPSTDYNSLKISDSFEEGLNYLKSTIKPNKLGGKPVVVGVHYQRNKKPYNHNKATYHFIVIVGKGYDRNLRKYYFRYYDVGKPSLDEGTNAGNKLYIDETQKKITAIDGKRTYTLTEVRKNY